MLFRGTFSGEMKEQTLLSLELSFGPKTLFFFCRLEDSPPFPLPPKGEFLGFSPPCPEHHVGNPPSHPSMIEFRPSGGRVLFLFAPEAVLSLLSFFFQVNVFSISLFSFPFFLQVGVTALFSFSFIEMTGGPGLPLPFGYRDLSLVFSLARQSFQRSPPSFFEDKVQVFGPFFDRCLVNLTFP